jgi:hypothetical protein
MDDPQRASEEFDFPYDRLGAVGLLANVQRSRMGLPCPEGEGAAEQFRLVQGPRSRSRAHGDHCRPSDRAFHAARLPAHCALEHQAAQVDYETAEAMLNHVKKGLERTYDQYELEEEKRAWFLTWEKEVIAIAKRAGMAKVLGVPVDDGPRIQMSDWLQLPQSARVQPSLHFGQLESRTGPKFAQSAPQFVLAGKAGRPAFSQPIDLSPGQARQMRKFIGGNEA